MLPTETIVFPRADARSVTAHFCRPSGGCRGILYAHLEGQDEAAAAAALGGTRLALCALSGEDWNADLSPWAAPRAFRKGADFTGGGPAYLDFLCREVLPAANARCAPETAAQGIAGYSMAGLFALWAALQKPAFTHVASLSGSLWFDGFAGWLAAPPAAVPRGAVLSLGDAEPGARDPRLAAVGACTRQTAERLRALGADTVFYWESGGHFTDISARCARGVRALAAQMG